jgi:hypothetical protein
LCEAYSELIMSNLLSKAAEVNAPTKLCVIALAIAIMLNLPFADSHDQPKPVTSLAHGTSAGLPSMSPSDSRSSPQRKLDLQKSNQPDPSPLTGQFHGVVHNQSAARSAAFEISVQDTKGILSGSMLVEPPLFGSGPLKGSIRGSVVNFAVNSSLARLSFKGIRDNSKIRGTYTVERTEGSQESGTFTLNKVSSASLRADVRPVPIPPLTPVPIKQPQESRSAVTSEKDELPKTKDSIAVSEPQNLSRCLDGYFPCNRSLLSAQQLIEVATRDTKRNLFRCLNGYFPCNPQLLTPAESTEVVASETRRNLSRCLSGYYPCRRNLLTPEQSADVDARELKRNSYRCLNGLYPCTLKLLTPGELAEVQARERQTQR